MQIKKKMAQVSNSIMISSGGGGGTTITVVANYSALPDPTTVSGQFYWAEASQGTSWLPGALGGTYYSAGQYYSNGTTWSFLSVPYQATQATVNTGTNDNQFVTPNTLKNQNYLATIVYADGKVADAINDGTTTIAPSQNAVFDALTPKQTNFYKDVATSTAVTGVTANTILVSALIPANTFAVGSLAEIRCNIQRVGTNGNATYRIYTNTSNSLSGATQLGTYNNTTTQLLSPFKRLFGFKTGNVIWGAGASSTLLNDEIISAVAPSSSTFDPTVANYFIIAVQPANASDSFTSEIFVIKGNK